MLSSSEWSALWMSLLVGGTALVMALVPGVTLGWILARRSFRGKILVEALIFLPLVLPPVVTGYLILVVSLNSLVKSHQLWIKDFVLFCR